MASRALRRRSTYRALNAHNRNKSRPLLRVVLVLVVAFVMLTSGASAASILLSGNGLPSLSDFKHRFQFQNTVLYASDGKTVLANLADLKKGRRIVEPLQAPGHTTGYYRAHGEPWLVGTSPSDHGIPVVLQDATIATEDATFYNNPGFDPASMLRAAYDDLTQGRVVSGASTITQQLIKQYLLKPDPTITRKVEEVILAAELTQKYPKSKILWYYLNSIPYGNLSVGAEAASETYFGEPVWKLDLAQSALLAGLPEAPSIYNPVDNRAGSFARMQEVLHLMYIHGYLKNSVGQTDPTLITKSMREANHWPKFVPLQTGQQLFPNFDLYAVNQLQNIPQLTGKIYNGLEVITTLNPALQREAQSTVTGQINQLGYLNVTDGALVSMDMRPSCYGCVLAMVGSPDFNNKAISGEINMADRPRQPGSSFKPFNYEYAFQHGLSPATTVLDGPLTIPDPGSATGGYSPTDYDLTWHGVVTLRTALANSLNVPAVRVEQYDASVAGSVRASVGNNAVKLGITSLYKDNPNCCGWSLTLGGYGVRLVEQTSAYAAFGTGGRRIPPIAILKVIDRSTGKVLYNARQEMQQYEHDQVIPPQYAYEITNVLSDNASRCTPQVCEFGLNSPLYLGRPAAAKTGTTNLFTDNWTVGYTPQIVTGVWVGNANDAAMAPGTSGITGAAPIWNQFMSEAVNTLKLPPIGFTEPPGVDSGSECQAPSGTGGSFISSFSYDIYAGSLPLCSIGVQSGYLPQSQPTAPVTAPTSSAPAATSQVLTVPTKPAAAPTVAPPTVAPQPTQAGPATGPTVVTVPGSAGPGGKSPP